MLIHAERFRYIENIVNIVFFCLFYKFLTNKHEVGSFVYNIVNLERLILISNVSTFRFEDKSLIHKKELSHHGVSKWNQTSPLLCIVPEINAWFWDLQHKIALNLILILSVAVFKSLMVKTGQSAAATLWQSLIWWSLYFATQCHNYAFSWIKKCKLEIDLENRIYNRGKFTRKKCKTAILLYCLYCRCTSHIYAI